ncbi:MFS transporter [Actinotalea soli]|uniref:MFS transporter n=1 Tax=Actinotalea soli TaxID=2819234 RepID=UPI0027DD8BB7|nr:MFS transporter [Actinotalea soli]
MVEPPEQRRTLAVLVLAQVLSGAGLAAGITVGALLAQEMLGATSLAGLPVALFTLGSAGAAVAVGRVSQRAGRRAGLALGYATGALGAAGVVLAAALDSVPLLFAAFVVYGAGTATNLQARYAGADLAAPSRRGRALSTVLVATTAGAVVGPNLVTVMGDVALGWGIPALAGPFVLAGAAYAAAGLTLGVLLRPDPLLLARSLAASAQARAHAAGTTTPTEVPARPRVVALAGSVMVVTQLVMVAIMTMTPIHMQAHGHDVGATGLVIAIHVGAMYLPSPLAGWLVDRVGARVVAGLAGVTLLASGLVAALTPVRSLVGLAAALALLGLGWSLGLVSGTAMLADELPLSTRARTQGSVDLTIAVAGAGAGMASGFVVASTSFATLSLAGGVLALLLVPVVAWSARRP